MGGGVLRGGRYLQVYPWPSPLPNRGQSDDHGLMA